MTNETPRGLRGGSTGGDSRGGRVSLPCSSLSSCRPSRPPGAPPPSPPCMGKNSPLLRGSPLSGCCPSGRGKSAALASLLAGKSVTARSSKHPEQGGAPSSSRGSVAMRPRVQYVSKNAPPITPSPITAANIALSPRKPHRGRLRLGQSARGFSFNLSTFVPPQRRVFFADLLEVAKKHLPKNTPNVRLYTFRSLTPLSSLPVKIGKILLTHVH